MQFQYWNCKILNVIPSFFVVNQHIISSYYKRGMKFRYWNIEL